MTVKREYGFALLAGAVGAGLVLLAVRQRWAQAVFTPPKPLSPQVVDVSGSDLVPLAGALALAALAGLAAVIATRGTLRRAAAYSVFHFTATGRTRSTRFSSPAGYRPFSRSARRTTRSRTSSSCASISSTNRSTPSAGPCWA